MKPSCRLKCLSGWFAAGPEFERALKLLSDGAFKLFAFVCLYADRPSGRLDFDRKELAHCLGKSRSTLSRQLFELDHVGICKLATAPNQHHASYLIVSEAYWPYCREPQPVLLPADAGLQAYVREVREMFLRPTCVQAQFTSDDQQLATLWYQAGVPIETFRRAWLLGCVRKSMTLINHPATQPIRSLRYFVPLLQEVQQEPIPDSYWQHLEFNLERCEDYWSLKQDTLPDRAYPFLEQANTASPDVSSPQPTTKGTLKR